MARNRDPKTGRYLTKLTPETRERILEALSSGVPPEVAAAYAGVVRATFNNWLAAGRAAIGNANGNLADVLAKDEHAQFALEVEEALARFVVGNMAEITSAGRERSEGEWQALGWQLERRFPQWFGRKTRHEVTGADGGPIQHQHAVTIAIPRGAWEALPIEDRLTLAELLGKIEGQVVEGQPELLALTP
jgi:RNA-splicing ligase RtcB